MLHFVPVPSDQWEVLQDIMNSQPDFLWLLKGKKALNQIDILKYLQKSKRMNRNLAFIKKDNQCIGMIDYQWKSPLDGHPWVGLFLIHNSYERQGYGTLAFAKFEGMVREKGDSMIRLGVHEGNDVGHLFWTKQGFVPFKRFTLDECQMIGLEKRIYFYVKMGDSNVR